MRERTGRYILKLALLISKVVLQVIARVQVRHIARALVRSVIVVGDPVDRGFVAMINVFK